MSNQDLGIYFVFEIPEIWQKLLKSLPKYPSQYSAHILLLFADENCPFRGFRQHLSSDLYFFFNFWVSIFLLAILWIFAVKQKNWKKTPNCFLIKRLSYLQGFKSLFRHDILSSKLFLKNEKKEFRFQKFYLNS